MAGFEFYLFSRDEEHGQEGGRQLCGLDLAENIQMKYFLWTAWYFLFLIYAPCVGHSQAGPIHLSRH